ncbi:MAG: hypothetical protein O3A01_01510 [bacterium]|nr:hypothetical protein [bacterium]
MTFCSPNLLHASYKEWRALESTHNIVLYPEGMRHYAVDTLYYLEHYRASAKKRVGAHETGQRTYVVLQDTGLEANGYASGVTNKIGMFLRSPDGENQSSNWLRHVSVHEMVHREQLHNVTGNVKVATTVFGNIVSPQNYLPRSFIEGIAVKEESALHPGEGRLNEGRQHAFVSAKAKARRLPNTIGEMSYFHKHFPLGQWYMYGARFNDYISRTYGEAKHAEFFSELGSRGLSVIFAPFYPPIVFDRVAREVYGKPFQALFAQWALEEEQAADKWVLGQNRAYSEYSWSVSNLVRANGKVLVADKQMAYGSAFQLVYATRLMVLDPETGERDILHEFSSPLTTKLSANDDMVYFGLSDFDRGFGNADRLTFGQVTQLYSYDLHTGRLTRLNKGLIRAVAASPEGYYYAELLPDSTETIVYHKVGKEARSVAMVNLDIFEMVLGPKDTLYLVAKTPLTPPSIYALNTVSGALSSVVQNDWKQFNLGIAAGKAGSIPVLEFTSNRGKQYQLYRYDTATKLTQWAKTSSYAEAGVSVEKSMFYSSVEADGMGIYRAPLSLTPTRSLNVSQHPIASVPVDFEAQLTEVDAMRASFSNIHPHTRLWPFYFQGDDVLNYWNYSIILNSRDGYDYSISTSVLAPLTLTYSQITALDSNDSWKRKSVGRVAYPLFRSGRDGIQDIQALFDTDFEEEHRPGAMATFRWPRHISIATMQFDSLEEGYRMALNNKAYRDGRSLAFSMSAFERFNHVPEQRQPQNWVENGANVRTQYHFRLAELRQGFWEFNAFVGDLYVAPYWDVLLDEDQANKNRRFSHTAGVDFTAEIGAMSHLHIAPTLGFALSTNEPLVYLQLQLGLF